MALEDGYSTRGSLGSGLPAVRRLGDPSLGALGWRQITVSTVGIVTGIDALTATGLNLQAASVVINLCIGASYAWSVFQKPLIERFGWSTSDTSLALANMTDVRHCVVASRKRPLP